MPAFELVFKNPNEYFEKIILSCPVYVHIAAAAFNAGCVNAAYEKCADKYTGKYGLSAKPLGQAPVTLVFLEPAPTVTEESVEKLVTLAESRGKAALVCNGARIAEAFREGEPAAEVGIITIDGSEGTAVSSAKTMLCAQERLRKTINERHLENGVFIMSPDTTFISPLAEIESGAVIQPNCQIKGFCEISAGCDIGPSSVIADSKIGDNTTINASQIIESKIGRGCAVGPNAYIRPGCELEDNIKVGDFVELKNAKIGSGTKISHLTYLGDIVMGKNINIGCGVVSVNYDGKEKHITNIGDDCFVGCNVNLISPLNIGKGAYVAAGSTITDDLPDDSFAIARSRQTVKTDWLEKRRQLGKL